MISQIFVDNNLIKKYTVFVHNWIPDIDFKFPIFDK